MSMSSREHSLMNTGAIPLKRSEKPPKLPPRDKMYPDEIPKVRPKVKFPIFIKSLKLISALS